MTEARPSQPSQNTLDALAEADRNPGRWIPFLVGKAPSLQNYYKHKYPAYLFSRRLGTLYVMKEAE